jgi:hypothetical protein
LPHPSLFLLYSFSIGYLESLAIKKRASSHVKPDERKPDRRRTVRVPPLKKQLVLLKVAAEKLKLRSHEDQLAYEAGTALAERYADRDFGNPSINADGEEIPADTSLLALYEEIEAGRLNSSHGTRSTHRSDGEETISAETILLALYEEIQAGKLDVSRANLLHESLKAHARKLIQDLKDRLPLVKSRRPS